MKKWIRSFFAKEGIKSVISSLLCILGGMLVGFLVLLVIALVSDDIPVAHAFKGLRIILSGPFAPLATSGSNINIMRILGNMLFQAAPLLMTGLSVAIAFKTGLFNIGAPGQFLMGAMGAIITAHSIPTTPQTAIFVWILAVAVGTVCGMIWGLIPGFFKAILNVNEVIVCIMTNWIAANLVSWVFSANRQFTDSSSGRTMYALKTSVNGVTTPKLGLDQIFKGSDIDIGILIAIAVAIIMFIMMSKTIFGYELKASGYNKHAAKYAGMNEKRSIMLSMAIAGGLAAMGATLYYLNAGPDFTWDTYNKLPAYGFNGIPVALLASSNPLGVIFSSVFLRYVDLGGYYLSGMTNYNEYVSDMIVAVIVYFAGFSMLIKMLLSRRKAAKAAKAQEKAQIAEEEQPNTNTEEKEGKDQ
ncbi:MAG: ABC transporter permease [Clostridia bacterium]|nr:ABC transporter permease [Clostridia bacterium]MBO7295896.1 ABC transporter permease [Clostridia bacterium]